MSKNYNDCDIVFDLLPLYLDGKTGEESNSFVQEHIEECAECREVYLLMSEELPGSDLVSQKQTGKRWKCRSRHLTHATKRTIILVAGLVGYLCIVIGLVVYAFWILAADVL